MFKPNLSILPSPQLRLLPELDATPEMFTLYGGTALALRLGHRVSVDFDFFSNQPFDPDELYSSIPCLEGTERIQVSKNTLTCRIVREDAPVLVSFFGALGFGQVETREQPAGYSFFVDSLLDIAGTKIAVIQKRAEVKDYLDIDVLLQHGIELQTILAAGRVVYGQAFNPVISLKALSYHGDMPALSAEVGQRLTDAVAKVNLENLPLLNPFHRRENENEQVS
jgi:hypothetical protein